MRDGATALKRMAGRKVMKTGGRTKVRMNGMKKRKDMVRVPGVQIVVMFLKVTIAIVIMIGIQMILSGNSMIQFGFIAPTGVLHGGNGLNHVAVIVSKTTFNSSSSSRVRSRRSLRISQTRLY